MESLGQEVLRKRHRSVPSSFAHLFPDFDVRSLHKERDAVLILARILERGGRRETAWASRHYSLSFRRHFIRKEGPRLLSARALRFWGWLWKVRAQSVPSWRAGGLSIGGAE